MAKRKPEPEKIWFENPIPSRTRMDLLACFYKLITETMLKIEFEDSPVVSPNLSRYANVITGKFLPLAYRYPNDPQGYLDMLTTLKEGVEESKQLSPDSQDHFLDVFAEQLEDGRIKAESLINDGQTPDGTVDNPKASKPKTKKQK